MTCDMCTLQWVWETDEGVHFQCADIVISEETSDCFGKCNNGGVCVQGECVCLEGFYGTYCDYEGVSGIETENILGYFLAFVIMVIVLLILSAIVYFLVNQKRLPRTVHLFFIRYFPWCIRNDNVRYIGSGGDILSA